jgi:hypothetical protein
VGRSAGQDKRGVAVRGCPLTAVTSPRRLDQGVVRAEQEAVTITDPALVAAATLADRYISDRFLPDKAIDLIDEAGARMRIRRMTAPPNLREFDEKIAAVRRAPRPVKGDRAPRLPHGLMAPAAGSSLPDSLPFSTCHSRPPWVPPARGCSAADCAGESGKLRRAIMRAACLDARSGTRRTTFTFLPTTQPEHV